MSAITIPDFKCSKQSSHGREERIAFIISEVKKDPAYHFEFPTRSSLIDVTDTINHCLRMMYYAPQTRKDITEQILMELKII